MSGREKYPSENINLKSQAETGIPEWITVRNAKAGTEKLLSKRTMILLPTKCIRPLKLKIRASAFPDSGPAENSVADVYLHRD